MSDVVQSPSAHSSNPDADWSGGKPVPSAEQASTSTAGRLSRRLLGRMVVVLLLLAVLVFGYGIHLLNAAFDAFERQSAESALVRVRSVLQRDSQSMGELLLNYTQRADGDADAVPSNSRLSDYMHQHFTLTSMRNLRLDAVLVLAANGQLQVARMVIGSELTDQLPPDLLGVLTGPASQPRCQQPTRDVIWNGSTPLMLASAPLRHTGAEQALGCMVLVRTLGSAYVAALKPQVGVAFSVLAAQPTLPTTLRVGDSEWMASENLNPWPAVLQVRVKESLGDERAGVVTGLVAGFGVLAVVGLAALYALLHVLVIRRISWFSALADEYRRTQDWTTTWPANGRDEIDNLGHSLNELVREVHWQVEYNATHDALTGLLNRQGLERVLSELSFSVFEHRSRTSCLMLIDLDNFKVVNDGFGHEMGDALLVHVAQQLSAAVRQGDLVARLGGDEFAVLLQNVQRDAVDAFSDRIMEHLRQPFARNDIQVATTGSAGLAFCDGVSGPAELMRNADLAMYQAKQQGRDVCAHFNDVLKVEVQRRNRLEQALRLAVSEDGIQVVFQPVVDMLAQQVVGIEALARWSLDGEAVSPVEFIPIAEECGLIGRLGMQILEKSCDMVVRLRQRGWQVACSVNLSARQFQDGNLVEDFAQLVAAHGLPTHAIRFEITESLVARSDTELALAMTDLNQLGFEFQLDDFGTGHSSLYRLQALPFQTIKIDRSFVTPLERGDEVMVRTVKDLARQLNLLVVAEGVETHVQLQHLLDLGVHRIQGFLVARPMSDAALLHWLATSPYAKNQSPQREPAAAPVADGPITESKDHPVV